MALKLEAKLQQVLFTLRETDIPRRAHVKLKHPENEVTGNLKYNATKIDRIENKTYRLFVDENIAPYVPYTNEPWISERWKGAKNPNEGWFEDFTEWYAKLLAQSLHGKLIKK